jgi:hypothetical protein
MFARVSCLQLMSFYLCEHHQANAVQAALLKKAFIFDPELSL